MRYLLLLILVTNSYHGFAQSTIQSIPNQKLINGSYVSNPDGIISESTVASINVLLRSVEIRTTVQISVVAVQSIGDQDVFTFAQTLFNTWKIGHKDKSNGLLVLMVMDSHTVRFHTGYGLESTLPDATCKYIQRMYMVPEFKKGNYDAGLLAGLKQVEKIVTDPAYADELNANFYGDNSMPYFDFVMYIVLSGGVILLIIFLVHDTNGKFIDSQKPNDSPYLEMRSTRKKWFWEFGLIPLVIVVIFWVAPIRNAVTICGSTLYLYFIGTLIHRLLRMKKVLNRFQTMNAYYDSVEFLQKEQTFWLVMSIIFPVPFLFYLFYHLHQKKIYRNHPRSCKHCNGKMIKFEESTEDPYLSKTQQFEESIKSVDYDVWKCESCGKTELLNYVNRFSKYDNCIRCQAKAVYLVSRGTVTEPTYTAAGRGEEVKKCKFCNADYKSSYVIAMKTESSSSGSSSGSYSSSSSSSSGGSWGGGSSGGGGSSSKW
jgi:uncharacterized protein